MYVSQPPKGFTNHYTQAEIVQSMVQRGVLLMNVGTPDEPTVESVRTYLREFLLDPDVIDIPAPLRHLLVRGIILRVRPKKTAPLYQKIWMEDGSPLRVYSKRITDYLNDSSSDVKFDFAMRYGNPSIESGLRRLRDEGIEELLLFPMFPHYAQATTESSLKHAYRALENMNWNPKILEVSHFEKHPAYIGPLARSIQSHLEDDVHVLFSYHGLPISHVKRIDETKKHCQKVENCCQIRCDANKMCYAHQCNETTLAVVERLNLEPHQWSISYQSRLGPVKWLAPATTDKVTELVKRGIRKLVIVAPAFLADGLETLEELDIGIREQFLELGGEHFEVIRCLNDAEDWIAGMHTLVSEQFQHIGSSQKHSEIRSA